MSAYEQMHSLIRPAVKKKTFFMNLTGFTLYTKWSNAEYQNFLITNGFIPYKNENLKASFPLSYTECKRK